MRIALRKYPSIVNAMENRHNIYNEETKYVFEQERKGNALVICPEKPLGISRTEKNPDELQRVYDEGRKTALARLDEIRRFISLK